MKKIIFIFALLLSVGAFACPELNGELGDESMTIISVEEYTLTSKESYNLQAFVGAYEQCKDFVELQTVRSLETGRLFKVIASFDHACDGDNTIGAILSNDETQVLGSISDSFISCFDNPIPVVR
jgi:hypothetical protein